MVDDSKMIIRVCLSIAVTVLAIVLLVCLEIPLWLFVILISASVIAVFLPIGSTKGDWASIDDWGIRIKAPFVDLSIPFSSITGAEMVTGFRPGLRMFGYGLMKRGSGNFTNDMLGSYMFAGTTAVDRMIIIRSADRKIGTVAFNLPSVAATEALFSAIRESTGVGSIGLSATETESNRRSHRSMKRIVIVISAISVIAVAIILALTMTAGHADAYLEDDALVIDATMMHKTVGYDEIVDIELRYDMGYGTRTGGLANSKILSGNFRNDEFGNYHLAVNRDVDACIVVFTEGKTKVFNLHSNEETESFFLDLQSKIPVKADNINPVAAPCPSQW